MKLTVEISLYPLQNEYRPIIRDFINQLDLHSEIKIVTNAMSTQATGEYDTLMAILEKTMKQSFSTHGKAVFIVNFIRDELAI